MYQTDLTETKCQYITKVLNLQERKRKYDLRMIWNAIFYLIKKELCSGVQALLANERYRRELIENIKSKFDYITQVVISSYKDQRFRPIHKGWTVERTFSQLDNNRRLCRNYEQTFDSAEEMVKIAAIKLSLLFPVKSRG